MRITHIFALLIISIRSLTVIRPFRTPFANFVPNLIYGVFLGEMQRIAFRPLLSSCVCVCMCVYDAFVAARKMIWDREVVFFNCAKWHQIYPVGVWHKSDYKFQYGGQNGCRETLYLAVTQPFIDRDFVFHWIVSNETGHQF